MEHRSALLASRGIASLALAFFAYEDLPSDMSSLDIGYFEEAADYVQSLDEVSCALWWQLWLSEYFVYLNNYLSIMSLISFTLH